MLRDERGRLCAALVDVPSYAGKQDTFHALIAACIVAASAGIAVLMHLIRRVRRPVFADHDRVVAALGVSAIDVLPAFIAATAALLVIGLPAALLQQRHSPIVRDASARIRIDTVFTAMEDAKAIPFQWTSDMATYMTQQIALALRIPFTSETLRKRVIETLPDRLDAEVELAVLPEPEQLVEVGAHVGGSVHPPTLVAPSHADAVATPE